MNTGTLGMNALVSLLVSLMVTIVLAAPVSKNGIEGIKQALKNQIKDQEQALESLTRLTNKGGSKGIEVSKVNSYSYSNINGAENKVQQHEEKVSDPISDNVISDINEKIEQEQQTPEEQPQTSFQASVDIPEEGIHKQISTDDDLQSSSEELDEKDTIAFTPEVVAEYLRGEGKVEEFQGLLNELVDNSDITPEEAEQYEKSVMDAFYNQEQDEDDNADMPEVETLYPAGYGDGPQPMFPMYNAPPFQNKVDVYPYAYDQMPMVPGSPVAEDRMVEDYSPISLDEMIGYLLDEWLTRAVVTGKDYSPVSLDEMIGYLLDEWLTRAVVTGDPEAAEILSNIIDYVSRDNNPNDEEQVKEILGDIIAETLLEDLMPRMEPLPVQDISLAQAQGPMPQAMPAFPFAEEQGNQQQQQQQQEMSSNENTDTNSESAEEQNDDIAEQNEEETNNKTEDLEAQLKM